MACFQFGDRHKRKTLHGDESEVGDYALHVQCAWRIIRGDEILVGKEDLYQPEDPRSSPDFNWEEGNLQDALLRKLFMDGGRQFTVVGTALRAAGQLDILFDDELRLEVFPNSSRIGDTEHWRLLVPTKGSDRTIQAPHIVFAGAGLHYE